LKLSEKGRGVKTPQIFTGSTHSSRVMFNDQADLNASVKLFVEAILLGVLQYCYFPLNGKSIVY